jgi:hypothetical protein
VRHGTAKLEFIGLAVRALSGDFVNDTIVPCVVLFHEKFAITKNWKLNQLASWVWTVSKPIPVRVFEFVWISVA